MWQQWMAKLNADGVTGQIVNVGSNTTLSVRGLSDFMFGETNAAGYHTIKATGGMVFNTKDLKPVAFDRGWNTNEGATLHVWNEHGAQNQRWQFEAINVPA